MSNNPVSPDPVAQLIARWRKRATDLDEGVIMQTLEEVRKAEDSTFANRLCADELESAIAARPVEHICEYGHPTENTCKRCDSVRERIRSEQADRGNGR